MKISKQRLMELAGIDNQASGFQVDDLVYNTSELRESTTPIEGKSVKIPSSPQKATQKELVSAVKSRNYSEDIEEYLGDKIFGEGSAEMEEIFERDLTIKGWDQVGHGSDRDGDYPVAILFSKELKRHVIAVDENGLYWAK